MDFKKLLEAMDTFAGEKAGQRPGDQVRGTEQAKPNKGRHPFLKRLVGELKQPKSVHKYEQELSEAWLEFKEAAPIPAAPAKPGQPPAAVVDPKTAAAIKTSATALKLPDASKVAQAATDIQAGKPPSAAAKTAIATGLADPLSDIMQNPQMANQLKAMIDKASKLDMAADAKAQGTTTPAPATPGAPVPPVTQPK
jgi:hypothetical protein